MSARTKALNLLKAREKAETGSLFADPNEWPGNSNLKHWVNSNRMDEEHMHGDGIGCFIKFTDAQFTELAFNDITEVVQWALKMEKLAAIYKRQRDENGMSRYSTDWVYHKKQQDDDAELESIQVEKAE